MPGFRSLILLLLSVGLVSGTAVWQAKNDDAPDQLVPALRPSAPRFWKGNLHTHSLWSDGDDFPEMIADWYQRHGYQFLTLSDHNVLADGTRWINVKPGLEPILKKYLARFGSSWVEQREEKGIEQVRLKPLREFRSVLEEPGKFLLIPGEEITHKFAKAPVHMNGINLRDVIKPVNGAGVAETIRVNQRIVAEQATKTGWPNVLVLNHPNFGWGVRAEDLVLAEELTFFEVFNGHPAVNNYGFENKPSCERIWDIALALRLGKSRLPALYALATDDAHGYHSFGVGRVNPGRGWIMVRAPYLSAEAIVRAMEAGDFYASTGVLLDDVRRSDKELALKIHAEPGVKYRTQFIATKKDADLKAQPNGEDNKFLPLTGIYSKDIGMIVAESDSLEPSYRLTGQELYVRATVTSNKRHPNPFRKGDVEMAWTQPAVP